MFSNIVIYKYNPSQKFRESLEALGFTKSESSLEYEQSVRARNAYMRRNAYSLGTLYPDSPEGTDLVVFIKQNYSSLYTVAKWMESKDSLEWRESVGIVDENVGVLHGYATESRTKKAYQVWLESKITEVLTPYPMFRDLKYGEVTHCLWWEVSPEVGVRSSVYESQEPNKLTVVYPNTGRSVRVVPNLGVPGQNTSLYKYLVEVEGFYQIWEYDEDLVEPVGELLVSEYCHDLVHTADRGPVFGLGAVEYCESEGEYYYDISNSPSYLETVRAEDQVFDWHDSRVPRVVWYKDAESYEGWRVGFEVEQECEVGRTEYNALEVFQDSQFKKERDGSLCSRTGYEMVSPAYKFDLELIKSHIVSHPDVEFLISRGGDYERCGTHINVSHHYKTGTQVFLSLIDWAPLLYALYPSRAKSDHDYCPPKNGKSYHAYTEKYGSFSIHSQRCEIRIFPVTKSVDTLMWRLKLVKLMLERKVATMSGVERFCRQGKVHEHLMEVYNGSQNRLESLISRAYDYSDRFYLQSSSLSDRRNKSANRGY